MIHELFPNPAPTERDLEEHNLIRLDSLSEEFAMSDGEAIVGTLAISPIDEVSAKIDFWIDEKLGSNGYLGRSLPLAAEYAINRLGYRRLELDYQVKEDKNLDRLYRDCFEAAEFRLAVINNASNTRLYERTAGATGYRPVKVDLE